MDSEAKKYLGDLFTYMSIMESINKTLNKLIKNNIKNTTKKYDKEYKNYPIYKKILLYKFSKYNNTVLPKHFDNIRRRNTDKGFLIKCIENKKN